MKKIKELFPVSEGKSLLTLLIVVACTILTTSHSDVLSIVMLAIGSAFMGMSFGMDFAAYAIIRKLKKEKIDLKLV